jgi:hypothetical protein
MICSRDTIRFLAKSFCETRFVVKNILCSYQKNGEKSARVTKAEFFVLQGSRIHTPKPLNCVRFPQLSGDSWCFYGCRENPKSAKNKQSKQDFNLD